MLATTFFTLSGLASLSTAGYVLQDDYTPENFFSMFDFFTGADPTHGYVNYVDQSTASSGNLINTNNGAVYMGVDSSNVASGSGRNSVRITSKASYNDGLVILDLAHMPGNACGSWPAFWMVGPSWPNNGEIDIIEGVNSQIGNAMTLHTSSGCSISNTGSFSGQIRTSNCDVNAAGQAANSGCGITTSNVGSFGDGFNALQGGVYATEWTSEAISIWYFPRSAIPSDITSGSPDPSGWGMATASFSGSCVISNFFKNQQIVFDTTFCGDWAGAVFATDSTCSAKASTCQDYVQNNPSAFSQSYWSINSLKVYSGSGSLPSVSASGTISIPISTASQGVPTSWPAGTGISSVISAPVPTASPQAPGLSSNWAQGDLGTKTGSGVSQGQFYQASTTDAAATSAEAAVSSEATPAAPAAAPTPEGTNPDGPVNVAVDQNGVVGEFSASASPSAPSIAVPTTTMSLGSAIDGSTDAKFVTVSAMTYDDFPKEKREELESERMKRRNVHRHMFAHKKHWGRRGAWRA